MEEVAPSPIAQIVLLATFLFRLREEEFAELRHLTLGLVSFLGEDSLPQNPPYPLNILVASYFGHFH